MCAICRCATATMLVVLCASLSCSAAGLSSVTETIGRVESAIGAVQTLRMHARELIAPSKNVPGCRVDGLSGRVVQREYDITWDATGDRYRLTSEQLIIYQGYGYYKPLEQAFDGERFRSFNPHPDARSGREAAYNMELYKLNWPRLLGKFIAEDPPRDLLDLLHEARDSVEQHLQENGLIRLEMPFRCDNGDKCKCTAWIDPAHGYLPARIQIDDLYQNTLPTPVEIRDLEVEIHDFLQLPDSTWVPIRGTLGLFYMDSILPEDISRAEVQQMTRDEFRLIEPRVVYVAKPMGVKDGWPVEIDIDASTLAVNEPVSATTFVLEFPPDVSILNELTDPAPLRANVLDSDSEGSKQTDRRSSILMWGNLAFLTIVGGILIARRATKRKP